MKASFGKICRALSVIAAYSFSGLMPRFADRWVFGNHNDDFDGNPKYLFLWISRNRPDIKAVWITGRPDHVEKLRRHGYRVVLRRSPSGLFARMFAAAYVFGDYPSDIGGAFSNRALLVNLWHGSGLKKLGFGNRGSGLATQGRWNFLERGVNRASKSVADVFIATSPMIAERFASQFQTSIDRCPVVGTPRLDALIDDALGAASRELGDYSSWNAARSLFREVYVYMPTLREQNREFLSLALPNLERLSAILAARDAVMFVKLHPRTKGQIPADEEYVRSWPDDVDFYTVINEIDCLISDYSSVMFDYLRVSSAGMVVYPFDYDQYIDERALYFPYAESVAGVRAHTFDELCDVISGGKALASVDAPSLARVRERCWAGSVHPASSAVTHEIERRVAFKH